MRFNEFNPTISFKTSTHTDFGDVLGDSIKKMTYYDGQTDFVDFNARQKITGEFPVIQLSFTEYKDLTEYFNARVGENISVTLDPGEFPFGPDITGTVDVDLVEAVPSGEQAWAENGNFYIDLKMSAVSNPQTLPEYDFLVECEISAWSVDTISEFQPAPQFTGETLFTTTNRKMFVWDGGAWVETFTRKRYEITYWDDTRVGVPTFAGEPNETAWSGGDRTYWVHNQTEWVQNGYPAVDEFKPVILNSDIPGLKNSKFYWSTFTDLPIDNSNPLDLLPANYESGIIEKKGIKFPKWSVSLENGPAIEKISGFSFKLQNADRKNILSNQINFFGSWCELKIWDNSQNKIVPIRAGINRTTGFSFSSFQFDVEPQTWNDNDKKIPSRSMTVILDDGDQGTTRSEDLIPQTYGSWDTARTKVKIKNVGPIDVDGFQTFTIIEDPTFDAVEQEITFAISINTNLWSPDSALYVKSSDDDKTFKISNIDILNDKGYTYPDGYARITVSAVQSELDLFDVGKVVVLVENKFQLIIDDQLCGGFGQSLKVFTYDSDANEYHKAPDGVFTVIDDHTIALGDDPTAFLLDDELNLYFGNPTLVSNSQWNHGPAQSLTHYISGSDEFRKQATGVPASPNPDIVFTYGGVTRQGGRNVILWNSKTYYNTPNDANFTARDIEINFGDGLSQSTATFFAMKYLPVSPNSHIWSEFTTSMGFALLLPNYGRLKMWDATGLPNQTRGRATDPQNQPGRSDGFYYHQINGGHVTSYEMKQPKWVGGFYNVNFETTGNVAFANAEEPILMTQRFPITPEVKNALRGAKNVRLLGSLYYSFGIGQTVTLNRNGDFVDYDEAFWANVRILGILRKDGDVASDRIIIDKILQTSDDSTMYGTQGGYRQSGVWGNPKGRHVVYNLPTSLGGNTEKYYTDQEETTSDYVRIIVERSSGLPSNNDPVLGATIRNADNGTIFGECVGFSGNIWSGNTLVDWVEILVQMDATSVGDFQVGDKLVTPDSAFEGIVKQTPTPDTWHTGRDLFKISDVNTADLFNEENYKFGDYDSLEWYVIPFYESGGRTSRKIIAEIGFGNPFDNDVSEHQGIFWESASELDLSDAENIFVTCQGRKNENGVVMESPDEIIEHQIQQIDKNAVLDFHPSANHESWKIRDQLIGEHTLNSLMSEYLNHVFGVITYGDSGQYVVKSLDYLDHPIQPGDFKADFTPSNIIMGSIKGVNYRDVDSIHTEFEFNFEFSPGKESTDRVISLRWNEETESLDISGFGGDGDSVELQNIKNSLLSSLSSELSDQFRVSRNFYNTGTIAKKSVDLPLFYDSETWVDDGVFPIASITKAVSKWVRFFLFNSWVVKFETKMDKVITDGVRLGDLVTLQFDSITSDQKLFGFVRSIKPKFYDGSVEIEMFASVDPWVYSKFYDRVWDAGLVDGTYNPDEFKHTEFFTYPFKDTNQNGTFSNNGDLDDPSFDPVNFQFTDDSVADPDEPFAPLP